MATKKKSKKKQTQRTKNKKQTILQRITSPILTALLWGLFVVTVLCVVTWLYVNGIGRDYIYMAAFLIVWGVIFVCAVKLFIKRFREWRYLSSTIGQIDQMEGKEFEIFLKIYFEKLGYKVSLTQASHDYGADLVCSNRDEVLVVQAKRYEANVGNAAVQQVVAAQAYYEADRGLVVTNSYFTKPAIELAAMNEVELWDRDELVRRVKKVR